MGNLIITKTVNDYIELKRVENSLFSHLYPQHFDLRIFVIDTNEIFNYTTEYNDLAKGIILITI